MLICEGSSVMNMIQDRLVKNNLTLEFFRIHGFSSCFDGTAALWTVSIGEDAPWGGAI